MLCVFFKNFFYIIFKILYNKSAKEIVEVSNATGFSEEPKEACVFTKVIISAINSRRHHCNGGLGVGGDLLPVSLPTSFK